MAFFNNRDPKSKRHLQWKFQLFESLFGQNEGKKSVGTFRRIDGFLEVNCIRQKQRRISPLRYLGKNSWLMKHAFQWRVTVVPDRSVTIGPLSSSNDKSVGWNFSLTEVISTIKNERTNERRCAFALYISFSRSLTQCTQAKIYNNAE